MLRYLDGTRKKFEESVKLWLTLINVGGINISNGEVVMHYSILVAITVEVI